ncbi:MAG: hypothetical protein ACKOBJ_00520 [Actinomycetota bacterium]
MKESRELALLRKRDGLRRRRQLWVAGVVVWGVVVGWVLFGIVNSISGDVDVRLTWLLTWLVPVLIFGAGTLVTQAALRRCEHDLLHEAE